MKKAVPVLACGALLAGSALAQSWTQLASINVPVARASHTMAFDSGRGRVVMWGGFSINPLDDTWEHDGVNWTQITTPVRPSARFGPAMAYDSARGKVVMFGGRGLASYYTDTWEYDGVTWTQVPTATTPFPRLRHTIVYDVGRGKIVMFGGAYSTVALSGERAGQRDVRVGRGTRDEPFVKGPLCADLDGFSLHGAVRVAAGDRKRLEHLFRYAGRPAIAESRLSLLPDGRVAYSLKKTWRDGSTHVVMEPQVLIERLLALVPRPRRHLVTYHGVLAPGASLRHRQRSSGR